MMSTTRLFPLDFVQLPTALFGGPSFRIEEYTDRDTFVVRAEVPGADPAKEISVTVRDGRLSIMVERTEERLDKVHSEFHYGSLARTVTLPAGAIEDRITARYEYGILEIRVPIGDTA